MNKEQIDFLVERIGEEGVLKLLEIPSNSLLFREDYESLEAEMLDNPSKSYFFPLSSIPFHRADHVQLSCLKERVDLCFYLQNRTDVKNLAFLDSNHTIYYNNDLVPEYMKEINPDVNLIKAKVGDLTSKELAIHFGTFWSENELQALSPEEFVPFPSSGIFVGVCHKNNLATRKRMTKYHSPETFDLSNIQRGIQLNWPHNNELIYLSSYARRDVQSNIHTTVAYLKNQRLEYIHLSQSTSFNMVEGILEKI